MLSFLKTLTYAPLHMAVAITVAYSLSSDWKIALGVGIIEPIVQTGFYYLHERAWGMVHPQAAHVEPMLH